MSFKPALIAIVAVIAVLLASSGPARAEVILSLQADKDLNALGLGEEATISVMLTLTGGESLWYLAATVDFDETILGTPTLPTEGLIVPLGGTFISSTNAGFADAYYDTLFGGGPIVSSGVFYSFKVTPISAGTTLFLTSADASDADGETVPITTDPPLTLNAVPEPAMAIGFLTMTATAMGLSWNRRRPRLSAI